jgi:broad specificity phosphatase PhoE
LLDGDEYGSWVDARLTEKGIDQAKTAHAAWEEQIQKGVPVPQSFYVSPLNRCLATANVTFGGLSIPGIEPFKPVVKEVSSFQSHALLLHSKGCILVHVYVHGRYTIT